MSAEPLLAKRARIGTNRNAFLNTQTCTHQDTGEQLLCPESIYVPAQM